MKIAHEVSSIVIPILLIKTGSESLKVMPKIMLPSIQWNRISTDPQLKLLTVQYIAHWHKKVNLLYILVILQFA